MSNCACCASSRRFEPWWPWALRILKLFIIIIIIIIINIIIIIIIILIIIIKLGFIGASVCIYIRTRKNDHVRTHVKDPVVHDVRARWIIEKRKDTAYTLQQG